MIGDLPRFFKDPHAIAGIPENSPLLIGLSGGADSAALLYLLCRLREKRRFTLYAAHVNHSIRTEEYNNEAERDEIFCKSICRYAGVELFVANLNVPAMAKESGQSLETAAREARYSFFADIMNRLGIKVLVTAHNADDNLETQIFNLCRGCGIEGICGIPEKRSFDRVENGVIVRPILSAPKHEILDLCKDRGIKFVTDSTNLENDCTRNRIRHNVLPELRSLFNSPERSGLRLAAAAREDSDYIQREADRIASEQNGAISVSLLNSLHPSIAKRVLRTLYESASAQNLESIHVEDLSAFAKSEKNGRISLPGKITAIFSCGHLRFSAEDGTENEVQYSIPLSKGENFINGTQFAVLLTNDPVPPTSIKRGDENYLLFAHSLLKIDEGEALTASNRREGELITSNGMHKKLKKLMCNKKIPPELRSTLPLIRSGDEVLYAPLCAVADSARPSKGTSCITAAIYKRQ